VKGYYLDPHPDANVASEHYAIVKMQRLKRDRCPETQVTLLESQAQAIAQSNIEEKRYPARVMGPARSSEGCNIFYILEILTSA